MPKARALIDGASLGPDALRAVRQAFDEAWAEIASHFAQDPAQVESARLTLANALLSIAEDASRDVQVLKRAALQVMTQNYTTLPIGAKIQPVPEAMTESYWRERAEEVRRLSESVLHPLIKRELIDITYGYERIAKMAGDHQTKAAR